MRAAIVALFVALFSAGVIEGSHAQAPGQVFRLADGAVAYRPARATPATPTIVTLLHGAGQRPEEMIDWFRADADREGLILLAPKAKGATWDLIARARTTDMLGASTIGAAYRYTTSPDGDRVAAAQADLARQVPTEGARQVLLGFSDGATFALGLATDRTRPYAAVIALSPGLAVVSARPARDRSVIIMHGRRDQVLPFAFSNSTIVAGLRRAGLKVVFHAFDGGHAIAPDAWRRVARDLP